MILYNLSFLISGVTLGLSMHLGCSKIALHMKAKVYRSIISDQSNLASSSCCCCSFNYFQVGLVNWAHPHEHDIIEGQKPVGCGDLLLVSFTKTYHRYDSVCR